MTNEYYNSSGWPATGAAGQSAPARAELNLIAAGFNKLPTMSGNGNKAVVINGAGNALTVTGGTLSLGANFTTAGPGAITLTSTGATNVTLPTTGTLATLAGTEELTNKTLTASVAKGTWTASGTWTIPAVTLGGTVTLNGQTFSGAAGFDSTVAITGALSLAAKLQIGSSPLTTHAINIDPATYGNALLSASEVSLNRRSGGNGMTFRNSSNDFVLSIFRNQNSGAGSVAALEFEHLDSLGGAYAALQFTVNALNATAGALATEMIVLMQLAGANSYPMHLQPTATTVVRMYNPAATYPSNWEALICRCDTNAWYFQTDQSGTGSSRTLDVGVSSNTWRYDTSGNYWPNVTSNTLDIGTSSRMVKSVYVGTRVVVGNATSAAGFVHIRNSFGNMLQVVEENNGLGIKILGESSADHSSPGANNTILYTKDDGAGETLVCLRTTTGVLTFGASGVTTNQTTFNLVNATATTLNIGAAATTIAIGNDSGTTTLKGNLVMPTSGAYVQLKAAVGVGSVQLIANNNTSATRTATFPTANTSLPVCDFHYTFSGASAARTFTVPDYNGRMVVEDYQRSLTVEQATAIPAGGTTGAGYKLSSTANFGIFFGSGAPTLSAAKGSIYLRSDGAGTTSRAYVNTDGANTWTYLTAGA